MSNAANLKTIARNVALRMGLDEANLSYEERISFNKELSAEILKFPQSFTESTLAIASRVNGQTYRHLDAASFDWSDFGSAIAAEGASINNAVNPFSEKNRKWILGVAVAGAAVYFLAPRLIESFAKKTAA